MMQPDHYALLVTINRYPGLSDLAGPENDGKAMKQWLTAPDGGGLLSHHVKHISSADFEVAANPDDANPTERELVRALNLWLRTPGGWNERVGSRIYLYFAGHGFTAGSSINDPALFTAIAQIGDTAHIAAYRYAAKIVNAGFFDEVVLIMDCCQDVLKASQVLEPTWSPPDRNLAAKIKFFQAYGAPRGRKAFEDEMPAHSSTRGLFSTVLLEALTSAEADANGWVSGTAVKNCLLKLWGDQYRQKTNYDPPVRLPDGEDILFYRRLPPLGSPSTLTISAPGMPARSIELLFDLDIDINRGVARVISENSQIRDEPMPSIPEPESVLVKLDTPDAGFDIVVLDSRAAKVAAGTGVLNVELMAGEYTALVRAPGASSVRQLTVERQPLHITLEGPQFVSAAPMEHTSTSHEYHQIPALWYSTMMPNVHLGLANSGELFLFLRDSGERDTLRPMSAPALRLVGLGHSYHNNLNEAWHIQAEDLFACTKDALAEGCYGLVLDVGEGQEDAIVFPIVRGWRTDVYLDSIPGATEARVPDLQRAVLFMTPIGVESPLRSHEGRAAEVARLRFQNGSSVITPAAGVPPLHALFAAYAAAAGPEPDVMRIRACLGMMPDEVRAALPDALLLESLCAKFQKQQRIDLGTRPIIPMIGSGWNLMMHLTDTGAGVASAVDAIGQWRVTGSVWTCWVQPATTANVMRRRLQRRVRGDREQVTVTELEPPWNLATWEAVANGLRKPIREHSPFQQALRRRILDCIADQRIEDPVPLVAAAFGLPLAIVARSYGELFVSARSASEELAM